MDEANQLIEEIEKLVTTRKFDDDQKVVVDEIVRKAASAVDLLSARVAADATAHKLTMDELTSHFEAEKLEIAKQAWANAYKKIDAEMTAQERCGKCGSADINLNYNRRYDHLECECSVCKALWERAPLDKK